MRSLPVSVIAIGVGFGILAHSPCAAQQPDRPTKPDTGALSVAFSMMNQMGPMYETMTQAMFEGTLKALEKQETINRLAAITRRYYEALLRQGFTKEEALQIVAGMKFLPSQPGR